MTHDCLGEPRVPRGNRTRGGRSRGRGPPQRGRSSARASLSSDSPNWRRSSHKVNRNSTVLPSKAKGHHHLPETQDQEFPQLVRGTCEQMCPLEEIRSRRQHNEISHFEINPEAPHDDAWVVKQYHRPAAGQTTQLLASQLRPAHVLDKTLTHLFTRVVPAAFPVDTTLPIHEALDPKREAASFLAAYHFVNDRIRSVRQDFIIQRIQDRSLHKALHQVIRFHLLASLQAIRLMDCSSKSREGWSNHLNFQQLFSAICEFHSLGLQLSNAVVENEHDHETLDWNAKILRRRQDEVLAYDILLHVNDPLRINLLFRQQYVPCFSRLRTGDFPRTRLALRLFVAFQTKHFWMFCQLAATKLTFLEQTALLHHWQTIWQYAVTMMNKSYIKQERVALRIIAKWLGINDLKSSAIKALFLSRNVAVEQEDAWQEEEQGEGDEAADRESCFIRFKLNPIAQDVDDVHAAKLLVAKANSIFHEQFVKGRRTAPQIIMNEPDC